MNYKNNKVIAKIPTILHGILFYLVVLLFFYWYFLSSLQIWI